MKGLGGAHAFQLLRELMETGYIGTQNPFLLQMLWQQLLDTDGRETSRNKVFLYLILTNSMSYLKT